MIARVISTCFIWFGFAIILTESNLLNASEGVAITAIVTVSATALLSTLAVWLSLAWSAKGAQSKGNVSKSKRVHNSRLLDSLDDDDLAELKARLTLLDDDAEQISLETLLHDQSSEHQMYR